MILADKIMNLRKRNGWSQEELAEQLGVSRQSISKYESAQSMPDLDKILKLSKIFGVSTDYLMKDELEDESFEMIDVQEENSKRKITMEMANSFLQIKEQISMKVAIGVALCITSPIALIFLGGASEYHKINMNENLAGGLGLVILITMIAIAVGIFVITGLKLKEFEFLEKEEFETEYGVIGMVRERKARFRDRHNVQLTVGILLCVMAVVPLFIAMSMENEFLCVAAICALLLLVAIGVLLIVQCSTIMGSYHQILEEEDYTKKNKKTTRATSTAAGCYWLIATAIYLGWSFMTDGWDTTWVVWPIAGVLFPVYRMIVYSIVGDRNK